MFLSLRIWLGRRPFGVIGDCNWPAGFLLSPSHLLNWPCEAPELEALRYVSENTTIPVPRIYGTHHWHGKLAIEMQFFKDCETLNVAWRHLTSEQRREIVTEVAGYVAQLRALQPLNASKISSTLGGPCRDVRVGSVKLFGPFQDSDEFHQAIRGGVPSDNVKDIFGEQVASTHARKYETKFTHGDLGVQNILVRDGKVVAIIDWECSGWYPQYWEYTKAQYNRVLLPEFYEMLDEMIERYEEELGAERELWRLFDQPLDQAEG
ncbi:hypothetical protein AC578_5629 [Pseudocercospora eumusae]|uniref:Aminoglycoside phosphotransferase domain-containing protein n=1 Tax=Pseudocercospora eumusae TaxID=321146 RepID=A0A139HTA1_9PEZI|nr:hypothetical protein AC578_5629 [Pseudocercospora eumusae]